MKDKSKLKYDPQRENKYAWAARNKDKVLKSSRKWRKNNPEKHRTALNKFYYKHKTEYREYEMKRQPERLLHLAHQRAKRNGMDFNLDITDIIIPTHCKYLGIKLTNISGTGYKRVQSNASLDRIDSFKGYIKGNVQVISFLANVIKTNATEDQLIAFAENFLKYHKKM